MTTSTISSSSHLLDMTSSSSEHSNTGSVNYSRLCNDTANEYPGETLGIVGFGLAFVLNLAGLVVSIIAFIQSVRSGHRNGFAVAGIVVSLVSIVLIIGAIFLSFTILGAFAAAAGSGSCAGLEMGRHTLADGSVLTCSPGLLGFYGN